MVYHTFDEWKDLGFHVNIGEKSIKRNELGKCVFQKIKYLKTKTIFHSLPVNLNLMVRIIDI